MDNISVKNQATFKVVLLGDSGVGKTSLIHKLHYGKFSGSVNPTVAASFVSRSFKIGESFIGLNLWDTAGQEQFRALVPAYARGAHAALVCYDSTLPASFDSMESWLHELAQFTEDCLVFIVGTKVDLEEVVASDKAQQWAELKGFKMFLTSAMSGVGVEELFQSVANELYQLKVMGVNEAVRIDVDVANEEKGKKCC